MKKLNIHEKYHHDSFNNDIKIPNSVLPYVNLKWLGVSSFRGPFLLIFVSIWFGFGLVGEVQPAIAIRVESLFPPQAFFPPLGALSRLRTPGAPRPRSRFCRPLLPTHPFNCFPAASVTPRHSSSSAWGLGGTILLLCCVGALIALFRLPHDCSRSPAVLFPSLLFGSSRLFVRSFVRWSVLSFLLAWPVATSRSLRASRSGLGIDF